MKYLLNTDNVQPEVPLRLYLQREENGSITLQGIPDMPGNSSFILMQFGENGEVSVVPNGFEYCRLNLLQAARFQEGR